MNLRNKTTALFNRYTISVNGRLFLASIIVGIIAGLGAIAFFMLLSKLSHFCLQILANYYPPEPAGEMSGFEPTGEPIRKWVLMILPMIGGLISGFLVFKFAPEAEGHGTDAVIESFHHKRGMIRKRVPLIKAISSIITIGTGGSAGREGPIAQIGAGFGSYLATVLHLTDDERRTLLIAGAAGGIGAIFRSPLGGALFAVEVLYKRDFESKALIPCLVSSITAFSIFASKYGFHAIFDIPDFIFTNPMELIAYAGLGVFCSLFGYFYVKVFYGTRDHLFNKIKINRIFLPAIGGLMLGIMSLFAPHALASGYGYLQEAMYGNLPIYFMLGAAILKVFATSFTVSSGGSGGVFAPSLFIGGMLGGAFGSLLTMVFPELGINSAVFVLVGMGSFFAGTAKVPISSMIMVSEMTGGYHLLVPMMIASSTSYLSLSRVSLYERQVNRMADSPAHMGDFTIDVLDTLMVDQAYKPSVHTPVLRKDTPLRALQNMISEKDNLNNFAVVDKDEIIGIISLRDVRSVLFEDKVGTVLIAKDVMNAPIHVTPGESLNSAMKKFTNYGYEQIPVVDIRDHSKILGMLSHEDVTSAYNREISKHKDKF